MVSSGNGEDPGVQGALRGESALPTAPPAVAPSCCFRAPDPGSGLSSVPRTPLTPVARARGPHAGLSSPVPVAALHPPGRPPGPQPPALVRSPLLEWAPVGQWALSRGPPVLAPGPRQPRLALESSCAPHLAPRAPPALRFLSLLLTLGLFVTVSKKFTSNFCFHS